MAKSTTHYWNPLAPEHRERWRPIEGLEGLAEELTLSIDEQSGEYTRLTRFRPGANTAAFGGKSHAYPEEVFIVSGRLYDQAFDQWLESGHFASRPPGEIHGPFSTDAGCVVLELSFPQRAHPCPDALEHDALASQTPRRVEFEYGVIRDWREEDIADLVEFGNNRKVWRNMADPFPHPYTEQDARGWIAHLTAMPVATAWAIEVDQRAVGGIGIDLRAGMYAKSAGFGYWLAESYWGRGIATAAARALLPCLLSDFRLIRLEAHVFAWNPASMRVLEKVGFQREGLLRRSAVKDGVALDQVLYAYVEEAQS